MPEVSREISREISSRSIAGRGQQHYSGPSESGLHSAVNIAHYWDSSEDFPGE